MRVEMFSEVSEKGGFIRRMDARVKIIVSRRRVSSLP